MLPTAAPTGSDEDVLEHARAILPPGLFSRLAPNAERNFTTALRVFSGVTGTAPGEGLHRFKHNVADDPDILRELGRVGGHRTEVLRAEGEEQGLALRKV